MSTPAFWKAFKELLIIILAVSFTQIFDKSQFTTHESHSEFTICNLMILVLIVYRFGFANIMLITERYENAKVEKNDDGFYHVSGFIAMGVSTLIMVEMSYRSEFNKYYGTIYVLFGALIFTDCLWEFILRATGRSDKLRHGWLINKVWWFPVFAAMLYFFKDHVNLVSSENLSDPWVIYFYRAIFILTVTNSAISLWVGRRVYFPFFVFADPRSGGGEN